MLRGAASQPERGTRASRIGIVGFDDRFSALYETALDFERGPGQLFPSAVINEALRRELAVEPGDAIVLHFAQFSEVPRETLMGEMEAGVPQEEISAKVAAIYATSRRFSLRPFGEGIYQVVVAAAGVRQLHRADGHKEQ